MKSYIANLIPRLRDFSEDLDKKEIFVEKPWVIIDEEFKLQKYIFKRNGELIMSQDGQVIVGSWEYISAAKSLLIDNTKGKILLNQNFIDPAVMILKKDGFKDQNLILANELLLPDLNVADYIKKLFYIKNSIGIIKLKSGIELELLRYNGVIANNNVTIQGDYVPDSVFEDIGQQRKYIIKNSQIYKVIRNTIYSTKKGEILIEEEMYYGPRKGDLVFQNGLPAPNGKYHIDTMVHIYVETGVIIKKTMF